jgi:hypothetical protein
MKTTRWLKLIFLLAISFALQVVFHEVWNFFFFKEKPNIVIDNRGEFFDPSLMRLSSVSKFVDYCDSVYGNKKINSNDSDYYAGIVSQTLKGRFYHGYSYYRLGQNFLAHLFAPFLNKNLSAIVLPDDILKHPNAACSQQSLIGMEVFRKKGFSVRKIGFFNKNYGGHFCFETFYNGKWHFFDPDLEPEIHTLAKLGRPGIADLVQRGPRLLNALYSKNKRNYVQDALTTYTYGTPNKFPAPNARIYQYATKYLSYTLWFWLILLYFFVRNRFSLIHKTKTCAELQGSLVPETKM